MPSIMPSWNMLIAIKAPVLPAQTATSASPFFTASMARHMLVSRPRRSTWLGLSSIATRSGAWRTRDAVFEAGMAGEQSVQHRFIAGQDEIDLGMALHHALQSSYDNAWTGIAAHRIHRNGQFAGHATLLFEKSREAVSSSPSRLRGRHNARRRRRHDAAFWVHRIWGSRHVPRPSGRDGTGACCGATARFFVWAPPWRETPSTAQGDRLLGAKAEGRWVAESRPGFKPKAAARRGTYGPVFNLLSTAKGFSVGLAPLGGLKLDPRGPGIRINGQHELLNQGAGQIIMQGVDLLGQIVIVQGNRHFGLGLAVRRTDGAKCSSRSKRNWMRAGTAAPGSRRRPERCRPPIENSRRKWLGESFFRSTTAVEGIGPPARRQSAPAPRVQLRPRQSALRRRPGPDG